MKLKFEGTATLEAFRRAVLKALDSETAYLFGETGGWQDQDLPALFRAIDAHTLILAERYGIELSDV